MIFWLISGLVKSCHWEGEKEWRMWGNKADLEFDSTTKLYYFPFSDSLKLREILIGPYCVKHDIYEELERLTADYPDPKPEIIFTGLSSFTFEIEKVT